MSYPSATSPSAPASQLPPNNNYPQTNAPPPAKRARLSPDAQSPVPHYSNGSYIPSAIPMSGSYGNPYAPGPVGQHQQYTPHYSAQQNYSPNTFNSPDAYQGARQVWQQAQQHIPQNRVQNAASPSSSQMMPPPPKPNKDEKERVGVDDMNDMLYSAGINLRDEENYVQNLYNNRQAGDSFSSQHGASFGSSGSFNMLTQGTSFGSQPNVTGAGTLGPVMSQEAIEEELKHKRTWAARQKAERDQHELKNPFLQGNVLRMRLDKISRKTGAFVNFNHLFVSPPAATTVMLNEDGTEGIAAARTAIITSESAPVIDVLSLLSLAAGERARALLDESYGLARARRYADYGRVPPEFSDVATGTGKAHTEEIVPENITGTSWDQTEGISEKPHTTISFQSAVNNELRSLAKSDQQAEKERAKKREARRKAAEAAVANDDETAGNDLSSLDIPGFESSGTPQPNKVSKKELARQAKERLTVTEAQASASTNQTATLAALGKKGARYSWMSAASKPTNRYAKPTPISSAPGSGSGTPARDKDARTPVGVKKDEKVAGMTWGEWRENSAGGRGIQVRDWLLVLERDGRQKRAWERTQLRLNGPPAPPLSSIVRPT